MLAESTAMKVMVATDAWRPQVNGVVRTLGSLARAAAKLGVEIDFLSPDGFWTFPVPTYPGLRLAVPRRKRIAERIEAQRPTQSTWQPKARLVMQCELTASKTAAHLRRAIRRGFPNIFRRAHPFPQQWIYNLLRRFHAAAAVTMVATPSLMTELSERGFGNLGMWTRGVDVDLFRPDRAIDLDFPRPIFMTVGRVAVERICRRSCPSTCPAAKSSSAPGRRRGN